MGIKEKFGTVRARLMLGFALLLAMILLLAGVVAYESYRIASVNLEHQTRAIDLHQRIDELETDLLNIETGTRGYLLVGEEQFLEPYRAGREDFEADLEEARKLNGMGAGNDILDPRTLDSLEAQYRTILSLFEQQIATRREGEPNPGALRLAEGKSEMDRALEIIARLEDQTLVSQQAARQSTRTALMRETGLAVLLGVLAILTVLGSMLYVRRGVISPLRELREGARKIGEGDLKHRIDLRSTDELGAVAAAFNEMLDRRREANAALQDSEERLRGLSEATFEGVAISENGRIIETNRAFAEMFGLGRPEVVGMDTMDFLAPESRETVRQHIASGSAEPYEAVGLKRDGTRFDVEVRGKTSSYRERLVRVASVRDVTGRKKAEERLREAEARYRTVVEQIPAITYVQEIEHERASVFVSPQVEAILGYTPEEYISVPELWMEILHPEDRERVIAEDDRTDETGEPFRVEYRMFAKDGRVVWVRDEAVLVRDEDENPLFWQGFMLDVTEEREAQEALRKSEARTRAIVETTPDGVISMTNEGVIQSFNPGAERIFGYPAEEVVGRPLKMLMPERFRGPHEAGFRRYLGGGEAHVVGKGVVELAGLRKEGTEFPLELSLGEQREEGAILFTGIVRDITERREVEEALRESEVRYRLVARATNETIWDSDLLTGRQRWDGAVETMFGYSPRETDEAWWKERVHPEDKEQVVSSIRTVFENGGEVWSEEYRFRRADGGYSTVVDRACVVRDERGKPVRHIGSIMDVTERRQAEDRLRASESELRALFAAMNDVILTLDSQGCFLKIAPTNPSLLYRPSAEIIGKTLHEVFPPEQADAFLGYVQRALQTRRPVNTEYMLEIGNEVVWFAGTVSPMQDDTVVYVARDITESKMAEDELRKAEERFRSAFDDAAVGMALKDLDGRFTQVNRALCEMLGYTDEELLHLTFEDVTHPEDVDASVDQIRKLLEGGIEGYQLEKRYLHADGHPVWAAVGISAVRDPEGNPLYLIAQIQDVTERKLAEEQLRQSQANLAEAQRMAHLGSWEWDITTGEVTWSDEVFRIYGYEPHAFVPTLDRLMEIVHPDDRDALSEAIEGALYRNEPYDHHHRIVRSDGTVRVVHRRARVVFDGEGEPLRMVGTVQDVTERKRTEEEIRRLNESLERRVEERTAQLQSTLAKLKESEERYALVVEGSNDGIFDWNIFDNTLFWNDRLFEMLGLSPSSFTPTFDGFFDLIHPDDKERLSEDLTAHLEGGEEFDVELRLRHASGDYRTCISRGKAQRDEDGRPFRMAGTATDITERKRAEEALRLLAKASAELSSSLDYHATLASIARLAVPQLADWCAVDILKEDGSLDRLAVVHQDPQKLEQARELAERYPSDPEAPTGLYNVLRTGRPEFYPEIGEEMLEAAARDDEHLKLLRELGFTSAIVVPIIARERTLGTITLVSAESGQHYTEADLRLAEDLASRSASAVDNARLYEEAQRELAERKRAEEEIRRLNESLETRVEERTAQLRNAVVELERAGEDLRRAKVEAESANRAKSDFLANMSHEVRTPMNGVIGMTDLLLDTDLSDEQHEYAATIRLSGESLLAIINDILDFSKIEAGEMRLETIDFDLRTAVEDVVALFAENAHDKGLELASLVDYDVPTALRGDPGRIRQILTNLVGNAIKFTEGGEVVLHAELAEEDPEEATVRISVRDTGIGMTAEVQGHVFESFSQADASTTRRYGGTGLGLTISKQIVELMGGEIGVESEPGAGSTFFFTLPLMKQPGGGRPVSDPLADLGGIRVLVVDDNATNREILHRQLSSWGMESGEAGDGLAALEELSSAARRGAPYDLAILDMQMPGMDGMWLARRISEDPSISSTRLVLLTSVGQRGDGEEARRAGIEAYLTKPVRQAELYDTIATVMGAPASPARPGDAGETPLVTRHTLRERQTGARAHLLLAEDNPVNQKVAARTLERLGYRVDVAQNGLEALEAIARKRYAAVLMDVQMPEMDGYEATAEIRRREREAARGLAGEGHRVPIIAMTANAMQGDREKALAAGMDDYLPKPVRQEALAGVLGRWVTQEAAEGDGGALHATESAAKSAANGDEGPLDPEVLAGLRELGDDELLSELAQMFLDDASSRLAALREAVEGRDAGSVERVAHTLKGSSGNMGASRMSSLCQSLQELGASGDLSRVPELLEQLEEEFGRVRSALETEVGEGRGA